MIDLSEYDLLQDRDNDESYTNGIWDLSYEVCNEKMEQEEIYNFLQEFKEKVLAEKDKEQNQKAIEQLEKIINLFEPYENENKDTILCANNGISFLEYINQQINELKGKVEYDRFKTR